MAYASRTVQYYAYAYHVVREGPDSSVTLDFAVDEHTPGLLPVEYFCRAVRKQTTGAIRATLEDEFGSVTSVTVEQLEADAHLETADE